jgi:putative acetyltransferase
VPGIDRTIRSALRASRSPRADRLAEVIVRRATPADRPQIFEVERQAFGQLEEAQLVERVLASPDAVPELEFVADDDGAVVGHLLFSHAAVLAEDGPRQVLALGPLAVRPDRQRQGIGIALTEAGLAAADALGEPLVVVLGHRTYYPRFGFVRSDELGITPPPEYPQSDFFALPLSTYDPTIRGRVVYPPTFDGV